VTQMSYVMLYLLIASYYKRMHEKCDVKGVKHVNISYECLSSNERTGSAAGERGKSNLPFWRAGVF